MKKITCLFFTLVVATIPFFPLHGSHAQDSPRDTLPTLVSEESLFTYLEALTSIQPYSGWRNSASSGEEEAVDYVQETLGSMDFLVAQGLELEKQEFSVLLGTEIHESTLLVTVGSQTVEVPADGLRGSRDNITQALRNDTDGGLTDLEPNPITRSGEVVVIRTPEQMSALRANTVQNKILFVDYELVDRSISSYEEAGRNALLLVQSNPAAIVLVTRFSNQVGESHGAFVGDFSVFDLIRTQENPPLMYVRVEDMGAAGISSLDDLATLETAEFTLDVDVLSPATSYNLVAHIKGENSEKAMILGAHIDSPNSPGALDDGSGAAILMEVARIFNAAQVVPPTDVVLVWFGSEETGLNGSSHFVATRQELLDRTIAMLQIDCLSAPLEGVPAHISLNSWSFGRFGDDRTLWGDYLTTAVQPFGIQTVAYSSYFVESDNTVFTAYNVPNMNMIYMDRNEMSAVGGVHYAGHLHSPYDTIARAREQADVFVQMGQAAVTAAIAGEDVSAFGEFRVTPERQHRAVFIGTYTEPQHISPTWYTDLGMALAMKGYDVDLIPYGQAFSANDLSDATMVVVLPPADFPSDLAANETAYDVSWDEESAIVLEEYAESGGFVVVTNSISIPNFSSQPIAFNEDALDLNVFTGRFGITYIEEILPFTGTSPQLDSPLFTGIQGLSIGENTGIPFLMENPAGEVLVVNGEYNAMARVPIGTGEVLVLADVTIFNGNYGRNPVNLRFWQNLADYALSR